MTRKGNLSSTSRIQVPLIVQVAYKGTVTLKYKPQVSTGCESLNKTRRDRHANYYKTPSSSLLYPTRTLTARQGVCRSSAVANLRASIIPSRILSSSISSAFDSGSRGGNGHPIPDNEHQRDTRACMSLHKFSAPSEQRRTGNTTSGYSPPVTFNKSLKLFAALQFFQLLIIIPPIPLQLILPISYPILQLLPHSLLASQHILVRSVQMHG